MSLICSANAMRALHRVLVCTRFEAYEGRDPKSLGDVMDTAEYLVAILQNHEGRPEGECLAEFRAFLQELEERFPGYDGLVAAFDTDPQAAVQERPLAMASV